MVMVLTAVLTVSVLATVAPGAAAHKCTAEKGESTEADCNQPCKEGEAHDHKVTHHHENGLGEDVNHVHFSCETKKDRSEPPASCTTPRILGMCVVGGQDQTTDEAHAVQA